MTDQERKYFTEKVSYAVIDDYEIEVTYFENGHSMTFWKDLNNNRCYEETGTTNPKSKFELVKRRIKNSLFDEILKDYKIVDKTKKIKDVKKSYIEIDFNRVKGFKKLTQEQRELFKNIYIRHNSCHGSDYKAKWTLVSVKWVVDKKDTKYSYLKVVFKNKEWLHYSTRGDWW